MFLSLNMVFTAVHRSTANSAYSPSGLFSVLFVPGNVKDGKSSLSAFWRSVL
jgi:hypothetical protein